MTGDSFMTWGWRLPFGFSFVLVIVGLWIRIGVEETPAFQQVVRNNAVQSAPVLEAFRTAWRTIILTMFLRMSELASFVVFSIFVFTLGVQMLHLSRNFILVCVLAGLTLECVAVPLSGAMSDRFGRKRVFMIGVALSGLVGFVYFAGFSTGSPTIIALMIVLSLIPHGIQYGPEGALIAESYPAHLRYSGSSMGYQLASILGAATAPFIATALMAQDPKGYLVACYLFVCAAISLTAAAFLKEPRRHFDAVANNTDPVASTAIN